MAACILPMAQRIRVPDVIILLSDAYQCVVFSTINLFWPCAMETRRIEEQGFSLCFYHVFWARWRQPGHLINIGDVRAAWGGLNLTGLVLCVHEHRGGLWIRVINIISICCVIISAL